MGRWWRRGGTGVLLLNQDSCGETRAYADASMQTNEATYKIYARRTRLREIRWFANGNSQTYFADNASSSPTPLSFRSSYLFQYAHHLLLFLLLFGLFFSVFAFCGHKLLDFTMFLELCLGTVFISHPPRDQLQLLMKLAT